MTTPLPISEAVKTFFPAGGIKASTLFAAIRSGALGYEKIGRTYFVTEADVLEWRGKCRAEAKARALRYTTERDAPTDGLSETERANAVQGALRKMLQERGKRSKPTWKKPSGRTPGSVTLLKSGAAK